MAFNYSSFGGYAPMGGMPAPQPMMGQTYGPMPPQPAMQPSQPAQAPLQSIQGISPTSRVVASKEEAMGVPADFNGNLMVFPDITHNRVFIKRWNFQSGAADFTEFAPVQPSQLPETVSAGNFVAVDVFQSTIEGLRAEIEALKKPVKGGKKSDSDE